MDGAAPAVFAGAVLHRLDLHVVPVGPEGRQDAAMTGHVAVPVGRAFPDAHRGEMGRLVLGDVPLVRAEIRDAVQPDLAVRPGLPARPFDAGEIILLLARPEM